MNQSGKQLKTADETFQFSTRTQVCVQNPLIGRYIVESFYICCWM